MVHTRSPGKFCGQRFRSMKICTFHNFSKFWWKMHDLGVILTLFSPGPPCRELSCSKLFDSTWLVETENTFSSCKAILYSRPGISCVEMLVTYFLENFTKCLISLAISRGSSWELSEIKPRGPPTFMPEDSSRKILQPENERHQGFRHDTKFDEKCNLWASFWNFFHMGRPAGGLAAAKGEMTHGL